MSRSTRMSIAGHRGLVGSAIHRAAVRAFFAAGRPEYVFLAAAKVGGIHANNTYPWYRDESIRLSRIRS